MIYSQKVMQLLLHPKNMGEMKNPSVTVQVGNKVCGDVMKLYLKITKKEGQDYIEAIKFQTLGCAAAIASSSILTEMVKGKFLEEALKVGKKEIVKELGGLPEVKIHCSVLAGEALAKAVKKYRAKK